MPKQYCTVKYPDFSKAIQCCLEEGEDGHSCYCAKSDWRSTFRQLLLLQSCWKYLVMKARCPLNKVWYYFFDKCLPFGSSVSCAHFQAFSDAIAHIMYVKTGKDPVNYLDNFLFLALLKWFCNHQVQVFLKICAQIKFPVSLGKTFWATTLITFLGMLIDTEKQIVSIPQDKIEKTVELIGKILAKKKQKATVIAIQQICGMLNFLCRAINPR